MFPFVLVCVRCSALQLLDVEDIFQYAVDAVTYPLDPIFDIFTHEFKPACRRAFLRIFRALDLDNDNLLSDSEMRDTELKCFALQISDEELVDMKRQISQGVEGGLRDEMVTFEGFLGLIKLILEDTSLRIPWQILRRFDYDDDLDFMIPDEVSDIPELQANQVMELSADAADFLLSMARIAHHECRQQLAQQLPGHENDSAEELDETSGTGVLTWDALNYILSVVASDVAHPWTTPPSFQCVWREDSVEQQRASRSLQQSVLLSSLPHIGANITFDAWLTQWHVLATNNPMLVQELLFRMGYIERGDLGTVISSGPIEQIARFTPRKSVFGSLFSEKPSPPNTRSTVNVCVLGDNCVGKSSFVWNLSGLSAPGSVDIEKGLGNAKPQDTVIVGGCRGSKRHPHGDRRNAFQVSRDSGTTRFRKPVVTQNKFDPLQSTFYVSAAAIPLEHVSVSPLAQSSSSKGKSDQSTVLDACDVAVLMFQCGDMTSFQIALQIEKTLPHRLPRLFLASKCDLVQTKGTEASSSSFSRNLQAQHEIVYQEAALHLQHHDLPELVFLSTSTGEGVSEALAALLSVAEEPQRGVPLKQRNPQGSTLWTLGALSFGGVLTGVAYWYLTTYRDKELRQWMRHFNDVSSSLWSRMKSLMPNHQQQRQ
eukprot:gene21337-27367_t